MVAEIRANGEGLSRTSEATEYGTPRNAADVGTHRYGWLGAKQRAPDIPSGIVLMGVRLFNTTTGRFLQPPTHRTPQHRNGPSRPYPTLTLSLAQSAPGRQFGQFFTFLAEGTQVCVTGWHPSPDGRGWPGRSQDSDQRVL
ncbi:hypothetical protein ABGB16_17470 [Micromonospora sp. B11E3]|uniref:hypothetical protein n=1 Tax=Micromonospora sp. B11E3 TaxID=3153562 RepID=UPI00325CAFF0